jgi:hypothetical protein
MLEVSYTILLVIVALVIVWFTVLTVLKLFKGQS